jgi:SWI/SNF-related matrix-associated actin-dependent regulator of chromatin subfamily B protein 1
LYSDVTPEQFAAIYAADLGLVGDFKTAVAHDIHEQVQIYLRSLFLVGHPFDGTAILDDDIRLAFLPPVVDVVRKEDVASSAFTPLLNHLTDVEMDRLEKDRERDLKRKRRQTRGRRGIILPDREPLKTNRTLLKKTVGALDPQPAPREVVPTSTPAPTSSRRAAAIAASAFITNMSKEDDMPIPEPPSPPPSAPRPRRAAPFASHALTPMRIDTPDRGSATPVDGVKHESVDFAPRAVQEDTPKNCKNCGIPEHLSGGMKKGPAGPASLCNQCGQLQRDLRIRQTDVLARYYARYKRYRKVESEGPGRKVEPSPSVTRETPEPDDDDDDDDYQDTPNGGNTKPRSAARRKIVQDSPSLPSSPKSTISFLSDNSSQPPSPPPPPPKQLPTPERKPVSKTKPQPVSQLLDTEYTTSLIILSERSHPNGSP